MPGTRGYLDRNPLGNVAQYEKQMFGFMESKHPDILTQIKEKNDISSDLDAKLKKALDEFQGIFQPAS